MEDFLLSQLIGLQAARLLQQTELLPSQQQASMEL